MFVDQGILMLSFESHYSIQKAVFYNSKVGQGDMGDAQQYFTILRFLSLCQPTLGSTSWITKLGNVKYVL